MGFAFLDRYDPEACSVLCNSRGYDPVGGVCQYFNIWRAVVDGVPTTYTCSMVRFRRVLALTRSDSLSFFQRSTTFPQTRPPR